MSKREELIERMFEVLWPLQEWNGEERVCREACQVALNAILAGLKADILAKFDAQLDIYETKKDDAWNLGRQDRWERFENYRDACDHMRGEMQAMLQTIEEPSHERE